MQLTEKPLISREILAIRAAIGRLSRYATPDKVKSDVLAIAVVLTSEVRAEALVEREMGRYYG